MKNRFFSLFNFAFLYPFIILSGFANTDAAAESYRFEQWSVAGVPTYDVGQYVSAKGLPQISIKAIVKDENGFAWLGSANRLARFDGRKFEFFNTINTPELGSNWIHGLFLDDTGRLWVVTGVGLVSFDHTLILRRASVVVANNARRVAADAYYIICSRSLPLSYWQFCQCRTFVSARKYSLYTQR